MSLEEELIDAAQADDLEKLKKLLDAGVNPNILDELGFPVILRLLLEKKQKAAEILLERGGDPNVPNKYGYNILHGASSEEHIAIMKFLLDHGADPDKKYPNSMSAIDITLEARNIPMFKLLTEHSKNKKAVFSTNSKGETILHLAAQQNDIDTFNAYKTQLFTKAKDSANLIDKLGYTPLYWSKLLGHEEITKELINHASSQNTHAYTRITAKESYENLPPRPKIAVSYNPIIGGKTSQEVLKRLTEPYCEAVQIDYREIVPEKYSDEKSRINLEEIKKQGVEKTTKLLAKIDALIIPGNNLPVAPEVAKLYGGEVKTLFTSDWARSFAEMIMVETAINQGMPIMGLCGGHQVINAYLGGKISKLEGPEFHDHDSIIIEPSSELAAIIKQNSNFYDKEIDKQHFWAAHGDTVKDIGGKNRVNNNKDLLTIAAKTSDGEIEATESKFGAPILTFQFHPEMTEDKDPKIDFSVDEILRDRRIFSLFTKSAETFSHKRELINEIKDLKSNIKPLVKKDISTKNSDISVKKSPPSIFR